MICFSFCVVCIVNNCIRLGDVIIVIWCVLWLNVVYNILFIVFSFFWCINCFLNGDIELLWFVIEYFSNVLVRVMLIILFFLWNEIVVMFLLLNSMYWYLFEYLWWYSLYVLFVDIVKCLLLFCFLKLVIVFLVIVFLNIWFIGLVGV